MKSLTRGQITVFIFRDFVVRIKLRFISVHDDTSIKFSFYIFLGLKRGKEERMQGKGFLAGGSKG
jgi:hypothetical protein